MPRCLNFLFETLETQKNEFSVKVTYIELYNEELKDLLTEEDSRKSNLKIFEDSSKAKKGSVLVAGLEEVMVTSATDVLAVLTKGTKKRQIASTNMNEYSSRSHSVFTISIQQKEDVLGEELVRVGKMHFVDLAGSENIARSGASDKRAREAGLINQSLLTLGRVINALVERSPHIPYRESKLTRLLQDSLGGRTITFMIAAISPAKCNVEETLSTLEYAHRAKNIKNKPEINQRLSKKIIMKEYAGQVERLKLDLIAAREKNGVFLSPETYGELMEENESGKTRIEEQAKELASKDESISQLEDEARDMYDMLKGAKQQLDMANGELCSVKAELESKSAEFARVQSELMDQKVLTGAHQTTELNLDGVARSLLTIIDKSSSDLDGLHSKLGRKSLSEAANVHNMESFKVDLTSKMISFSKILNGFELEQTQGLDKMTTEVLYVADQVKLLIHDGIAARINQHSNIIASEFNQLLTNAEGFADNQHANLGHQLANSVSRHDSLAQSLTELSTYIEGRVETLQGIFVDKRRWLESANESARESFHKLWEGLNIHLLNQSKTIQSLEERIDAHVKLQRETERDNQQRLDENARRVQSNLRSEQAQLVAGIESLVSKFSEGREQEAQNFALIAKNMEEKRLKSGALLFEEINEKTKLWHEVNNDFRASAKTSAFDGMSKASEVAQVCVQFGSLI